MCDGYGYAYDATFRFCSVRLPVMPDLDSGHLFGMLFLTFLIFLTCFSNILPPCFNVELYNSICLFWFTPRAMCVLKRQGWRVASSVDGNVKYRRLRLTAAWRVDYFIKLFSFSYVTYRDNLNLISHHFWRPHHSMNADLAHVCNCLGPSSFSWKPIPN